MSNSNIDDLMLKFAMSRLKRAASIPVDTAAYRNAAIGTPSIISDAQYADGYRPQYAYNSEDPTGVTPEGWLSTQSLSRGPDSAYNPFTSMQSFMDPPGFGGRGTGVGGDLLAGALAGGATTAGLRAYGNKDLWKYKGMDLSQTPRYVQQRAMETAIRPNGNPATVTRVGDTGESRTGPKGSPLVQAQAIGEVPPQLKFQSGPSEIQVSQEVPGRKPLLGRLVGVGTPGAPEVMTKTLPQITPQNLVRGAIPGAGGVQPNTRSTNPLIRNPGKFGLLTGGLATLASRLAVGNTVEPPQSDQSYFSRMTSAPIAPVQKSTVLIPGRR